MTEQPMLPTITPPAIGASDLERIVRDLDRKVSEALRFSLAPIGGGTGGYLENGFASGGVLANGSTGNVIWTRDFPGSMTFPAGTRKVFIKAALHAEANANQDMQSFLQYRFNSTGGWNTLDSTYERNAGVIGSDLGNTLVGWLELTVGATLNTMLVCNVAGGGGAVGIRTNNLRIQCFR